MDRKASKNTIFDSKILWVVVSIVASVLLWVYVTTTEGDVYKKSFEGVNVVFNGEETLRERDGMVITNVSSQTVNFTLTGTRRSLSNLSDDNLTAIVDVSKITTSGQFTSVYSIGYPAGVSASSFTLVSSSPQTVSFRVDRETSKVVEVKGVFNGSVAEGFSHKPLTFDPETISISGPEDELKKVAYAWVPVDRQDVNKTLIFESDYILMDAEGNEVPLGNIVKEVEAVTVTLTITQRKEVPLTVDLAPGAGASAENVTVVCDPASITITGDAATLESINKISLGTIDLATFETTLEQTFPIVLPDGVTNVTGLTEAKVTLQVVGLEIKRLNVTNISIINLPEGFVGEAETESVSVTLRGAPEVLKDVLSSNVRVVVDLSQQGSTGSIEAEAKVHVDGVTNVGAIGPYKVFIKIS